MSNEDPPKASDFPENFDAVAAAKELEEALAQGGDNERSGTDEYVSVLEKDVTRLNELLETERRKLAKAKEGIAKESERADRAQEEIERAKQRVATDAKLELEQKRRKLLVSVIELLDDLSRAIASANEASENSPILDGVEAVERKFHSFLAGHGVTAMGAKPGDEFTPDLHDALSMAPASEPSQNNTIAQVYEPGYKIGDDVLRAARVIVFKHQGAS